MITRRRLLGGLASLALLAPARGMPASGASPYGPPRPDPAGLLDLPDGFRYTVVSRVGDAMDDGLVVPGRPDGMHAFAGPDGTVRVVRNHELDHGDAQTAFDGLGVVRRDLVARLYDPGKRRLVGRGGTTTFSWDPVHRRLVDQHLSLGGTLRNCAGGATPHGSWLSCEESTLGAGRHGATRDHGFVFEVPAVADGVVAAEPLAAMGRFNHEAVGVDPRTGIVYLTEDRMDGLFYRFVPRRPGRYREGGRLEALEFVERLAEDTSNHDRQRVRVRGGVPFRVRWLPLEEVDAPRDDLRRRGRAAGAATFARGEGVAVETRGGATAIWFACTAGGRRQLGQLWRYVPSVVEGGDAEFDAPATLELFLEPDDPARMRSIDNLAVMPDGDLLFCEDHRPDPRLVGVAADGATYTVAVCREGRSELTGATFAPDGATLFVNVQQAGLTLAIDGPWRRLANS